MFQLVRGLQNPQISKVKVSWVSVNDANLGNSFASGGPAFGLVFVEKM